MPSGSTFNLTRFKRRNTMTHAYGRNLLPLSVGFDHLFSTLNEWDELFANKKPPSYPPYNILKYDESHYVIEIAVAGFDKEDISVSVDQDQLVIKGHHPKDDEAATKRRFQEDTQAAQEVFLIIERGASYNLL